MIQQKTLNPLYRDLQEEFPRSRSKHKNKKKLDYFIDLLLIMENISHLLFDYEQKTRYFYE